MNSRKHDPARHKANRGLTLIETLVGLAVLCCLLPLIAASTGVVARPNRERMCAFRLANLGSAMLQYTIEYDQYLPGSPGTSGAGLILDYDDMPGDAVDIPIPVTQIWDWAAPLAPYLDIGEELDPNRANRMKQLRHGKYWCPANPFQASVYLPFPSGDPWPYQVRMQSYNSMRQFYYYGSDVAPGGRLEHYSEWPNSWPTQLPSDYMPRLTRVGTPTTKTFIADGSRLTNIDGSVYCDCDHLSAFGGSFADGGPTLSDSYLRSYLRDPLEATLKAYRHSHGDTMGINVAHFDGHVEWVSEPDSRHPSRWFPTGTVIPRTDMNLDSMRLVIGDLQGANYIVP